MLLLFSLWANTINCSMLIDLTLFREGDDIDSCGMPQTGVSKKCVTFKVCIVNSLRILLQSQWKDCLID